MLVKTTFLAPSQIDEKFKKRLIKAAEKLGDMIWKKGLQGNSGIMNGISGCGYAFHCIFRYYYTKTKNLELDQEYKVYFHKKAQTWFLRAYYFGQALIDKDI
jgi:hypothetical protein